MGQVALADNFAAGFKPLPACTSRRLGKMRSACSRCEVDIVAARDRRATADARTRNEYVDGWEQTLSLARWAANDLNTVSAETCSIGKPPVAGHPDGCRIAGWGVEDRTRAHGVGGAENRDNRGAQHIGKRCMPPVSLQTITRHCFSPSQNSSKLVLPARLVTALSGNP